MTKPQREPGENAQTTRREFVTLLGSTAGAAWISSVWPLALADAAAARQASARGEAVQFRVLSPQQAADFGAFADRIIPPDDTPGARDAGVAHFADRFLGGGGAHKKPEFERALIELDRATRRRGQRFAVLPVTRQDEIIKSLEGSPAFITLRDFTLLGYFSHPSYGGNAGGAAWKAIGFEERMAWQPPFGYYDRPEVMAQLLPPRRR